jgi:hypothetical protein
MDFIMHHIACSDKGKYTKKALQSACQAAFGLPRIAK